MKIKPVFAFMLISAVCLTGCMTMEVRQLRPSAVVNIQPKFDVISIQVSDTIPEEYIIPSKHGIKSANVEQWNTTILEGFSQNLSDFYTISSNSKHILRIEKAEIEFLKEGESIAQNSYSNYPTTVTITKAQIKYRAVLLKNAEVEESCSGRALSLSNFTSIYEVSDAVESAFEVMIEQIASDLLNGN
jgi:hypothetical protein